MHEVIQGKNKDMRITKELITHVSMTVTVKIADRHVTMDGMPIQMNTQVLENKGSQLKESAPHFVNM